MEKETNSEIQNNQIGKRKSNYHSRRSFYLNKKKNQDNIDDKIGQNNEENNEPKNETKDEQKNEIKKEMKIQVTKKIIKKTKEKKPYIHHSQPKLKLKSISFEDDKSNNHIYQLKKNNSFKININIETLKNNIFSSKNNNKFQKYTKYNNKIHDTELNESNSVENVVVKNASSNKNDTKENSDNKNGNKIILNLKKENKIDINNNKTEMKNYRINNYKSPDNTNQKTKMNINTNMAPKNNTKTNKYITTNVNIVATKTNITKNVVEVKKNKTQQKMDMLKSQGKSLLLGALKKECTICHKYVETHLLKIHMNLHFCPILHWLYLGNFENACDLKELRRNNIGYILNCAIECKNKTLPKSIIEMHLDVRDDPAFYIIKYFEKTNEFINKVRTEGGSILVHCKMGLSRSPSFIIAYLIKYYGFTVDSAINYLKRKRPYVNINYGFIEQLHEYENSFKKRADK